MEESLSKSVLTKGSWYSRFGVSDHVPKSRFGLPSSHQTPWTQLSVSIPESSHKPKNELHLGAPQPPVADAAFEELLKGRHKRMDTFPVVLIPWLMTPRWRQLFNKVFDFSFVVSPGVPFWLDGMYEPLWVGIFLPFSIHRPWCFKRALLQVEMGRDLREMLIEGEKDVGDILQKLLKLLGLVASMSERMACKMLHVSQRAANLSNNSHR
jgi:hypothetical protein